MIQFIITQPVEGENRYHVAVLEDGVQICCKESLAQEKVVAFIRARCGFGRIAMKYEVKRAYSVDPPTRTIVVEAGSIEEATAVAETEFGAMAEPEVVVDQEEIAECQN